MKQRGFHRNKTSIAHFSRSLFGNLVANRDQLLSPINIFPLQDLVLGVFPDQFTPPNAGETRQALFALELPESQSYTLFGSANPDRRERRSNYSISNEFKRQSFKTGK